MYVVDTSGRYILMAHQAEELQKDHKWRDGDAVARVWWNGREVCGEFVGFAEVLWGGTLVRARPSTYEFPPDSGEFVWLPSQRQLQEMVILPEYRDGVLIPYHQRVGLLLNSFANWCDFGRDLKGFETMEELWLGYVMWKLYDKAWDWEKGEWIRGSYDHASLGVSLDP